MIVDQGGGAMLFHLASVRSARRLYPLIPSSEPRKEFSLRRLNSQSFRRLTTVFTVGLGP
jgi:hypothetical protein